MRVIIYNLNWNIIETIAISEQITIKINKDIEQYFWIDLEDFKQKFNNDNFVFLLLSCKQYQSLFPDKINKKNPYETEIDHLVWVYEKYLSKNTYKIWIDSKDHKKLFELLQGISNNKSALTLIYNNYKNLIWEHIAINNRQNEIDQYISDNILECMQNNLWILFWEENEITRNKENNKEMINNIELLSSTVRDMLYKQLNITDEEKWYVDSIIDKSIESAIEKTTDKDYWY